MNFYEILEIDQDATEEEILRAIEDYENELFMNRVSGAIDNDSFNELSAELDEIKDTLLDENKRSKYDKKLQKGSKGKVKKGLVAAVATGAVAGALAVSMLFTPLGDKVGNLIRGTNATSTSQESTVDYKEKNSSKSEEDSTPETSSEENVTVEPIDYGDINDKALVTERATTLVNQLNAMKIINPSTGVAYTVDEIYNLILYVNGVYTPSTMEEIDVLHLNLLNLLISPLNTDSYLYHVVYASGNDDFKDLAIEASSSISEIDFASGLAEYGTNGVYPLTQWIQQKREEIFKTTDRETINKIYIEVGQVMADIMKGNGCTITITENGKENTYTYTSEQILANHASAMLLTTEAQLIFANHYEVRDINNNIVDQVQSSWEVYNKFNGDEPDVVTLDEIQAWINNGCDYEWGIDDVLINGQTFGQRIQGDLEGMAQNNYAMSTGNTLTK